MKLNGLTIDPVTGKVSGVRLKKRGRKRRHKTTAMVIKQAWQSALRDITDATADRASGTRIGGAQ